MTVLEALKSEVSLPIGSDFFEKTLIARGLKGGDDFTADTGKSEGYRLAYADCLKRHATAVNFSETGISLSLPTDRKILLNMANEIYSKYGEPLVQMEPEPTATYIGENWDNG